MTQYFNIDRYRSKNMVLISIYILLFDTNTNLLIMVIIKVAITQLAMELQL